jgi:hypothetical protein
MAVQNLKMNCLVQKQMIFIVCTASDFDIHLEICCCAKLQNELFSSETNDFIIFTANDFDITSLYMQQPCLKFSPLLLWFSVPCVSRFA